MLLMLLPLSAAGNETLVAKTCVSFVYSFCQCVYFFQLLYCGKCRQGYNPVSQPTNQRINHLTNKQTTEYFTNPYFKHPVSFSFVFVCVAAMFMFFKDVRVQKCSTHFFFTSFISFALLNVDVQSNSILHTYVVSYFVFSLESVQVPLLSNNQK